MEIKKASVSGTLESGDVQIMVLPNPGQGIQIELEIDVKLQFGDAIERTVREELARFSVDDACIRLVDKGALDCVIRARMACVLCRAAEAPYDWTGEDGVK